MPNKNAPSIKPGSGMEALVAVVRMLREPGGCPWDREQTHESLTPHMLEEAYEAVAAIKEGDTPHLEEELGDVLLQVVLHSQIANEEGTFTLDSVACRIAEKLVRRHPHVFADAEAENSDEVLVHWDAIKRQERGETSGDLPPMLKGVGEGLPALLRADKIQRKAAKVGFDWPTIDGAREKIVEELAECDVELAEGNAERIESEIGDLLFAVVNLARMAGVGAEVALSGASDRFQSRFSHIEASLRRDDLTWKQQTLEQLEERWETAKNVLNSQS